MTYAAAVAPVGSFNEAGVRRPRGRDVLPSIAVYRVAASTKPGSGDPGDVDPVDRGNRVLDDASTKPGSGDPGDFALGHIPPDRLALLQRSRGPETPGTGGASNTWQWRHSFNEAGSGDPGDRRLADARGRLGLLLQRSRGPETPGTPVRRPSAAGGASRFNEAGVRRPRGRRAERAQLVGAKGFNEAGVRRPRGPTDHPPQLRNRDASTKPGSGDPGDRCSALRSRRGSSRFNEAGVRRPRGRNQLCNYLASS